MTSNIKIDKVSGEGPSPQSKEFGAYLRNLRKGIGLNQADLAKLVTISPAYYGFLEQGRQIPSLKIINRLAEILNTDYLEMAMRAGYDEFVARKKEVYRPKDASKNDGGDETDHQSDVQAQDESGSGSLLVGDSALDAGTPSGTITETLESGKTDIQETIGLSGTGNGSSNSALPSSRDDLGLNKERLDWAMGCISRDPTYKLAEQFKQGELSRDVKVLVVQLYQAQTQRQLLTAEESQALSYTLHG